MAASRVASSRRLCNKYKFFFYIAFCVVSLQLYMGYNFYSISQTETKKLEDWKSHVGSHGLPMQPEKLDLAYPRRNVSQLKEEVDRLSNSVHNLQKNIQTDNLKNNIGNIKNNAGVIPMHKEGKITPKCDIDGRDALSAIDRAKTLTCKQEIADVFCKSKEGKLFPPRLPRYCPLQDAKAGEYLGCYADNRVDRALTGHHTEFRTDNSPAKCINHCLRAGFRYAGLQYSYECWCGDSYAKHGKVDNGRCNSLCPNKTVSASCGAFLTLSVYNTGYGIKPYNPTSVIRANTMKKSEFVRIVFVLTVNGRAIRQIRRLFKALYHERHYFFIHVDSRQDYLHQELSKLIKAYPNVRMAKRRFSSIWGGASLLTMLLSCMDELIHMTDWKWDFFLNLSESDFPIKTEEELTAFLTKYKDKNFVKSHGKDTPRFIRKQGLDKVFYECDTHMWRIDSRVLPDGIRMDGGSDWICLNREFCQYLVTEGEDDGLVKGLKQYYKYALLPAESFFHTVLQNSKMCASVANNNLHLTNWRRKQGCKCQYKHIVDWCGCSPNDFKPSDMSKIMNMDEKATYFARKFEAIVSTQVINSVDAWLYGHYPKDTPGLASFWQNDWHHLDKYSPEKDAYITFYNSVARMGTSSLSYRKVDNSDSCKFTPVKILEATLYTVADEMQGLLVLYDATRGGKTYRLETFVMPIIKYKVVKAVGKMNRLKFFQVGNQWDPKEEMFRNYARILGPQSEVHLIHSWGKGTGFTVTVAWIDPANTIAASYDVTIDAKEYVGIHKPQFSRPIRPGVWTVKMLYDWDVAAEIQFLVLPLSTFMGNELTSKQAPILHSGPEKFYTEKDFLQMAEYLSLEGNTEKLAAAADENAKKTGDDLLAWIDEVNGEFWRVSATCLDVFSGPNCPSLLTCTSTTWSSLTPDPKSMLGPVDLETGRIR